MNRNLDLRDASGHQSSDSPLVAFLYDLMRDHLPVGVVHSLVIDNLQPGVTIYTNGFLQQYAVYLAEKLTAPKEQEKPVPLSGDGQELVTSVD